MYVPRWAVNAILNVTCQQTPVRYVKGKKNDGHIKTYSTKKISNGYPTMCSGAFLCPETNNPICPGNAPRDPTKIVLVNGQQVELCGCCAGSPTTPLDIRQHFPNRDFNTTNFVPIANHNDPNSYYNVGMNYFQGFIGSKTLCNTLVGKGLRVKRTKQFDPTDQFTIEDMENQLSEAANNEQDYIFSNTLQRNVILSDANYWHGGVAKALTKYVQPFKGYLDRFEPAQNNNTCEVINGWISYYKTQRETGIPRSAHFTYGLFNWHRDAGLTGLIENRLALTWLNDEDGTVSKRMFFVDRSTGDWFSFLCSHGCAVSMSREVSGFSDGRYMHKVVDAEGTYALVLQYKMNARSIAELYLEDEEEEEDQSDEWRNPGGNNEEEEWEEDDEEEGDADGENIEDHEETARRILG